MRSVLVLPTSILVLWTGTAAYVAGNGNTGDVAFTASEITFLGVIAATLVGALSFVFRLLIKAKDNQIKGLQKQIDDLLERVQDMRRTRDWERGRKYGAEHPDQSDSPGT